MQRYFSTAQQIEFPTERGLTAFANYYAPTNPDHAAPAGERPPLVVKCHGGPTSSASSGLSLGIQFWTSCGIAVLYVDYGGSTGYGRAYRDRLQGMWGVIDVEDCLNAVKHAVAEGLTDGERAVITGGSAGGYTVLAALAGHDVFKGGASYYGIGDIAALARDTHKFESRYLDSMIGPYPERADLYRERSPINPCGAAEAPRHLLSGQRRSRRSAKPDRDDGRGIARSGHPGRVPAVRRRVPRLSPRRKTSSARLDAELYFYATLIFRCRLSF